MPRNKVVGLTWRLKIYLLNGNPKLKKVRPLLIGRLEQIICNISSITGSDAQILYPRCSHIKGHSQSPSGFYITRTTTVERYDNSFPTLNTTKWPTSRIKFTTRCADRLRRNKCPRTQHALCHGYSSSCSRRWGS